MICGLTDHPAAQKFVLQRARAQPLLEWSLSGGAANGEGAAERSRLWPGEPL